MSSREIAELTNELRSLVESKNKDDAVVRDKIERVEKKLEEHESKNEKLVSEIEAEKKEKQEIENQLSEMEKKMHRVPKHSEDYEAKSAEVKAFETYISEGKEKLLENQEHKYLRTDNDLQGGYLAPTEYVQEIIRKIREVSPVRQVATVRTTSRESITIPKENNFVTSAWTEEGGAYPTDNTTYAVEVINVNKLSVITNVTVEMISDAAFDVEQEINNQITREFAKREGAAFIKGDGVGKPQGIVTNTDIQEVNSGVSNDITADSLIEIAGELKDGYNPAYMLNRRTLARIRTLKGGDGHYLWQPGLGQGIPNTINGLPYFSAIDLDDVAAGNIPVLLGDFGEGYNIVDSDQMSMLRDPYSSASTGKVRFIARRRVGGQVVLPEAIKKLKIAT